MAEARVRQGLSMYLPGPGPARPPGVGRVAFACPGDRLGPQGDRSSATDVLRALAGAGVDCQAFCPVDDLDGLAGRLASAGWPAQLADATRDEHAARLLYSRSGPIPVTWLGLGAGRLDALAAFFETFLDAFRPVSVHGPEIP